METEKMIPANEFCLSHNIEVSVIYSLNASGLIDIISKEEEIYIPENQLSEVEKLIRLHLDMEINIEGIEAITYLLQRLESMQRKISALNNKLGFYESD